MEAALVPCLGVPRAQRFDGTDLNHDTLRVLWALGLRGGREAAGGRPAVLHCVQAQVERDGARQERQQRPLLQLVVQDGGVAAAGGAHGQAAGSVPGKSSRQAGREGGHGGQEEGGEEEKEGGREAEAPRGRGSGLSAMLCKKSHRQAGRQARRGGGPACTRRALCARPGCVCQSAFGEDRSCQQAAL